MPFVSEDYILLVYDAAAVDNRIRRFERTLPSSSGVSGSRNDSICLGTVCFMSGGFATYVMFALRKSCWENSLCLLTARCLSLSWTCGFQSYWSSPPGHLSPCSLHPLRRHIDAIRYTWRNGVIGIRVVQMQCCLCISLWVVERRNFLGRNECWLLSLPPEPYRPLTFWRRIFFFKF